MNIKDKIAIGLTIIIVVIFGFILNGRAANVDNSIASNADKLAELASKPDKMDDFLNIDAKKLYKKYINHGTAVYWRGAMCMYHIQSGKGTGKYYIYRVLDFSYNSDDGFVLKNNR